MLEQQRLRKHAQVDAKRACLTVCRLEARSGRLTSLGARRTTNSTDGRQSRLSRQPGASCSQDQQRHFPIARHHKQCITALASQSQLKGRSRDSIQCKTDFRLRTSSSSSCFDTRLATCSWKGWGVRSGLSALSALLSLPRDRKPKRRAAANQAVYLRTRQRARQSLFVVKSSIDAKIARFGAPVSSAVVTHNACEKKLRLSDRQTKVLGRQQ